MKIKFFPPFQDEGEVIALWGQAQLVRYLDGKTELRGGSKEERLAAQEWTSMFLMRWGAKRRAARTVKPSRSNSNQPRPTTKALKPSITLLQELLILNAGYYGSTAPAFTGCETGDPETAQLIKYLDGKLALKGGSKEDRLAAHEWISFFWHEVVVGTPASSGHCKSPSSLAQYACREGDESRPFPPCSKSIWLQSAIHTIASHDVEQ
jgi:hypothetical protein